MKKNNSTLALSAALLALMLITAACNNNGATTTTAPSESPTSSASASPPETAAPTDSNDPDSNTKPEVREAAGEYIGLIDSHSIEVKMNGEAAAFQISPELAEELDAWASNIPVKFSYTEEKFDINGEQIAQYTIISIDKQ